jgi:tetratricopeptide (TPR) repeat protein
MQPDESQRFDVVADRLRRWAALFDEPPFYPEEHPRDRAVQFALRGALLVLLAFVVSWPLMHSGLLWTDAAVIDHNALLRSIGGLWQMWRHPSQSPVPPLTGTMQWLEYQAWAGDAGRYHLVSAAIHAVNGVLAWLVLRRLGARGAFAGAALWTVHPLAAVAVGWASWQEQVLGACLMLGAVLGYLRFARVEPPLPGELVEEGFTPADREEAETPWRAYAWSTVLFALAVLAHPPAMVVPVALVMMGVGRGRRRMGLVPWGVLCAVTMFVVLRGCSAAWIGSRFAVTPWAAVWCGRRVVWPFPAVLVDPGMMPAVGMRVGAGAALLLAIGAAIVWRRSRVAMALAIVVLLLGGESLFPPNGFPADCVLSDRMAYLAALPLAALMAAGVTAFLESRGGARFPAGLLVSTVAFVGFFQAGAYRSEEGLWKNALAARAEFRLARDRLIALYLADGRADDADALLRPPAGVEDWLQRATVRDAQGRTAEAIAACAAAAELTPADAAIRSRLGALQMKAGDAAAAVEAYEAALRMAEPGMAAGVAHNDLALALSAAGRKDEAIEHFRQATELAPAFAAARVNLANALFAAGDLTGAAEQLQRALEADPANFEAYLNAGTMLARMKDFTRAERMFRAAVRLRPASAEAHDNLGIALAAQGQLAQAAFSFAQAARLKPDDPGPREHLEAVRRQLRGEGPASP